jgi:hypothetical protein
LAIFLPGAPRRKYGEITPNITVGIFNIRIPFWHWGVEPVEVLQAMVMFVTGMGAIAVLQDMFGMPFEIALTIVCFHELTYCLHQFMGDPIISGWITPAIPLTTAFLLGFEMGPERIHALIALQLLVGIIFLILGLTGLAAKLLSIVPKALQAGIILGAAIAAVTGKYLFLSGDGYFYIYPISITVGGLGALFLLFSKFFQDRVHAAKELNARDIFVMVANYGMVPGLMIGIIVGWIVGEIPLPVFQKGLFFVPHVREVVSNFSPLSIGFPPLHIWIAAIPMAFIAYVIAFGDMVIGATVVDQANREYRLDEEVNFNPNRLHLLCAFRNFLEGSLAPTVTLAGPVWAAMTVAVTERYKLGRQAMDSIYGGAGSFNVMKFLSCLILPLVCIFQPALPVALSLTMLIQAFACGYVAMQLVKTNTERGLATVIGGALAIAGPTMGLVIGIILCLVLLGPSAFAMRHDDDIPSVIANSVAKGKKKDAPSTQA